MQSSTKLLVIDRRNEIKPNPNLDETGRYLVLPSFGIEKETRVHGNSW